MPTQIPVDFRFKRGNRDGLAHLAIEDGSLIFTMDTQEFFVDTDSKRLVISGVEFYNTEAEIKALEVPGDKIYVAKNTRRILAYSRTDEKWIYLSSSGVTFGTCDTAADQKAKEVTIDGDFVLETGASIIVKYDNTNTCEATVADPITLNVNNTGARNIFYGDTPTPIGNIPIAFGEAGVLIQYMYDGSYWVWMGASKENDTLYSDLTVNDIKIGTDTTGKLVSAKVFKDTLNNLNWSGTREQYEQIVNPDPEVNYYING